MIDSVFRKLFTRLGLLKSPTAYGSIPKEYLSTFLPAQPIIVEAGAHIGTDTQEMANLWKEGTIYAFEPVPKLFEQLVDSTLKFRNVRCFPVALGDRIGSAEIFISGGSSDASSSLLPPQQHLVEHPTVEFSQKITIQTVTLDQWAKDNKVDRVDFLWLDMQGYEPLALSSSPNILSTVSAIYTEVSLKQLYEGAPLYPDFRKWLESKGFRVEREELAWEDAGNVLFVREREV
jgi:2-O-methyltransferase